MTLHSFPIVFPLELGCLHLFYPITKLLKIFARNLHIILKIDYILTYVIHFKYTLLLKDIISWHVGGGFYGPLCRMGIFSFWTIRTPGVIYIKLLSIYNRLLKLEFSLGLLWKETLKIGESNCLVFLYLLRHFTQTKPVNRVYKNPLRYSKPRVEVYWIQSMSWIRNRETILVFVQFIVKLLLHPWLYTLRVEWEMHYYAKKLMHYATDSIFS